MQVVFQIVCGSVNFEYGFKSSSARPIAGILRSVPFALRSVVRQHGEQLLEHCILETSDSASINSVSIAPWPERPQNSCTNTMKINSSFKRIIAEVSWGQVHEHLGRMSNVFADASQGVTKEVRCFPLRLYRIPIHTAPYSFRNLLSAFVHAQISALDSETSDLAVCYVDNILCFGF
jgi:hypothetical protein